jgi:hypothetical protein
LPSTSSRHAADTPAGERYLGLPTKGASRIRQSLAASRGRRGRAVSAALTLTLAAASSFGPAFAHGRASHAPVAHDSSHASAAHGSSAGTTARASKKPSLADPPAHALTGTAAQVADWVSSAGDNDELPFMIVDKLAARIFVFDAGGRLRGSAPALVGLASGDDSADGIGERPLSAIAPADRTTPAGRFVAHFGAAKGHVRVLWVDYADAISLHPVVTTNPAEHRLRRIKSDAPQDHRISYGCINVPAAFYKAVVLKALKGGRAVVYILPDTRTVEEVFPAFAGFEVTAARGASEHQRDAGAYGARDPDSDDPQETGGR